MQHFPNLSHCQEIFSKALLQSDFKFSSRGPTSPIQSAQAVSRSPVTSCAHGSVLAQQSFFTKTLCEGQYPLRLLRDRYKHSYRREIRLLIHGSAGGKIHSFFYSLAEEVSQLRKASVQVEALTSSESPLPETNSLWLVPLFLLPGKHVRHDVPAIRDRFKMNEIEVTLLPFLGSWASWLFLVREFVGFKSSLAPTALVHHPVSHHLSFRYLALLNKILQIPIVPWSEWHSFNFRDKKKYSIISWALTPNRVTDELGISSDFSSLLQIAFFRTYLIEILRLLP